MHHGPALAIVLVALTAPRITFAQVVYLNDRSLSKVTAEANPHSVDFRYQINDKGTDFSLAYLGNFENAPSTVGFDAGNEANLNGVSVTFVIQNLPGQGIAFFAQVSPSEKSEEISSVIAWGSNFKQDLSVAPEQLKSITLPKENITIAETLEDRSSGKPLTPDHLSYNSISLVFHATTDRTEDRMASVKWEKLEFNAPAFKVSEGSTGLASGSLIVEGSKPEMSNLQTLVASELLNEVAWTLSGRLALNLTGFSGAEAATMTIQTGNHSFAVVPESEDYGLLIGVPLVTAAFWRVRRRAAQ